MSKRMLGALLTVGLVASGFAAAPVGAQTVTSVPDVVQITDPAGDGNFLNDQGFGGITGYQGDNSGGVGIGAGDILHVWFTHDEDTISAHIHTTFPPPNQTPGFGIIYRVHLADDCIWMQGIVPSNTYAGEESANLRYLCDDKDPVLGEITVDEIGDETGVTTLTYPRSADALFATGSTIAAPYATSRVISGGVPPGPSPTAPQIDNTLPGDSYEVAALEPAKKKKPKKKAKKDPPGQTVRQCNRFKNKKKRQACKRRARQANRDKGCAAYEPGEMGQDVEEETTIVTDAATEEEPIEMEFEFGPAGGHIIGPAPDLTEHIFHNVQIDSKEKEVGFWARLETPPLEDPDLYVYWDNGTVAAQATGFNPLLVAGPVPFFDGTGNGGHSGFDYEQIDGIGTADCTGYTLDLVNWLGFGGTYTLTLWLGDVENEAKPRDG